MTFTNLGDETGYTATTSGNVVTFDPALLTDVQSGDLIILFWDALTSSLTVSSCADNGSGGQTYDISSCTPKTGGTHSFGWVLCRATGNDFGTLITITLSGNATFRSGTLLAFRPSNHNWALDTVCGGQNDAASPVDTTGGSGTLAEADELGVACWGWRGTSSDPGFAQTTPAGWTNPATFGIITSGSNRSAAIPGYKLNIGATTTITATATFTSLTNCHSFLLTFTDILIPSTVRPRVSRPLRVWGGR